MRSALLLLAYALCGLLLAQPGNAETAPIPDAATLLREASTHQRQLDKVRENYTYREHVQIDDLDSNGSVKKSETEDHEILFVNSHQIERTVKKNGKDLSESEQKKEQDRVNKEVERALKTPPGESINRNSVSISRLLEIMKLSAPRRVTLNSRETYAFDFVGDPNAKTHGIGEDASKKISGTIWIDTRDHQVARLEARFDDNFHVAGGLVANVQKGSTFVFEQAIVNNELWLPTGAQVHLGVRLLLLKGIRQNITIKESDYQRFHTDAVQQSGVTVSDPSKKP